MAQVKVGILTKDDYQDAELIVTYTAEGGVLNLLCTAKKPADFEDRNLDAPDDSWLVNTPEGKKKLAEFRKKGCVLDCTSQVKFRTSQKVLKHAAKEAMKREADFMKRVYKDCGAEGVAFIAEMDLP